jgi:hypothetical protein
MWRLRAVAVLSAVALAHTACGGSATTTSPSAAPGAGGSGGGLGSAGEPVASAQPAGDGHLCRRPIDRPSEVWDRIEAVRALGEEERAAECGLGFIDLLSRWRVVPVDLLEPIVERAAADEGAFVDWVRERAVANPPAAAHVVAMDVIRRWKIGGTAAEVTARADQWRGLLAGDGGAVPEAVAAVLDAAAALPALFERVTEIHRMRCLLEVNPLGFAVQCVPLHPSGRPIVLSWKTTTRDGMIESIEVTECKGPSCKKIKKAAAKLLKQYKTLLADVERLEVEVYRDRIKAWLVLPPFRSIDA